MWYRKQMWVFNGDVADKCRAVEFCAEDGVKMDGLSTVGLEKEVGQPVWESYRGNKGLGRELQSGQASRCTDTDERNPKMGMSRSAADGAAARESADPRKPVNTHSPRQTRLCSDASSLQSPWQEEDIWSAFHFTSADIIFPICNMTEINICL